MKTIYQIKYQHQLYPWYWGRNYSWVTNKLSRSNTKNSNKTQKVDCIEALTIIDCLEKSGHEIIYLDEFKYDAHNEKQYGWSKIGENVIYFANPDSFSYIFIIWFQFAKSIE